ncbi:type IX secretion system protein PorD [Marinirhabdus gelatinilytica]|uniref:Uncharacterized protein DUF4835 n=1 Tax=Marinirhabdus gelatinilytica TaxID=1703343 RepID=A0A370QER9_9FLAO|nr:DUF4835 family protein [Marinirhabdus gelatinilytica]RDK86864.1 uncharacterized protein DUF4835 [Marinirhabdus gelatinilytica]
MYKHILTAVLFITGLSVQSQELNASITIDAEQTGQPNMQVFRTLESQLTDFVNNTQWTNRKYLNQERIDCNFTLIISSYENDSFSGTLQVQASRPIYGSTYDSPVYNYNDKQFSFDYVEFQPLTFNINSFDSNLMSVLAFHIYTVIGLDADTFEQEGGLEYFETAKQIVNTAAGSGFSGWKATDGTQSRFRYNDALLSNVYREFHEAMYAYHRQGLDVMATNPKQAKTEVKNAITKLKSINDRRPNSYILRTFFDAKSDEIAAIFSGGPQVDIVQFIENLNRMAPTRRSTWAEIKF